MPMVRRLDGGTDMAALRIVNLFSGSLMIGSFMFGAVTVARAHGKLPAREAWGFHQFVSRRVDWYIPASAFTATVTGWLVWATDEGLRGPGASLYMLGALLLTSYVLPFCIHPSGLRNELAFLRIPATAVDIADATRRMRSWNRWHHYRTWVGVAAHICFLLAWV